MNKILTITKLSDEVREEAIDAMNALSVITSQKTDLSYLQFSL